MSLITIYGPTGNEIKVTAGRLSKYLEKGYKEAKPVEQKSEPVEKEPVVTSKPTLKRGLKNGSLDN